MVKNVLAGGGTITFLSEDLFEHACRQAGQAAAWPPAKRGGVILE